MQSDAAAAVAAALCVTILRFRAVLFIQTRYWQFCCVAFTASICVH